MKRLGAAVLMVCVWMCCCFVLPACAETVTKDGIEVTLTTDKENYDSLDVIDARLTVKNTNSFDVDNVSMEITAPKGMKLSESGITKVGELSAGEQEMHQISVRDANAQAPALPQTGDDSKGMLWIILLVLSAAVLCGLVVRNPQAKRMISLFLCIAMVSTMVLESVPVMAEKVERNIVVNKQVFVDGKPVMITGEVGYSIEYELAEKDENKVTNNTKITYEYADYENNDSQETYEEVSPMLFAISIARELKQIIFDSVSYAGIPGNTYTFSWKGDYSDTYIVNVKILDGSPAYTDDEAGTSIVLNQNQSENSIQFVVPEDILNGTYIKVHVYGETDGQQTESGNQIYMQIGGDCEHPYSKKIVGYDSIYIPLDEEKHQNASHRYTYCGECGTLLFEEIEPNSSIKEKHTFNYYTNTCTVCNYKMESECDHDFSSVPGKRFTLILPLIVDYLIYHGKQVGYTLVCSKCGEETRNYVSITEEHEYNSENTCICGQVLSIACDHRAPVKEQVGDTVYYRYPEMSSSPLLHTAVKTYRVKCSVCGMTSDETDEEYIDGHHEYNEKQICIYCGSMANTTGDITAPEMSDIVSSAGDTINSGERSTFSATIKDDRILKYVGVYFDGQLKVEYINPPIWANETFELEWTRLFSKKIGDQHTVTFTACDAGGNWVEKEYAVTVTCDHSNEEIQEWAGNTEQIEGNNEVHHVLNTTVTKCLECGYEIDREVTKKTEAHKFVDRYCMLCGYTMPECLHDTCKDEYNPNIPILYKDNGDGKTHTWQNGYDCTCLTCGRVTHVYGEEQIAEHDYSTRDLCPCGFDVEPPYWARFDFSRNPISGDASDIHNMIFHFMSGSAVTFTLSAADNVQLEKLELFRDGVLVNQMDCTDSRGELTYTTEELTAGTFVLKFVATDTAGWVSTFVFNINVLKSDCTHENYADNENGEIKYTEKDETSHYYQLGYDRICDKCQETWQVYSDLSEDMVKQHDYTNGDICPCGYDRNTCQHDPAALEYVKHVIESIAGDHVNHQITGVVYKATCGKCQKEYEVTYEDKDIATGETFPYKQEHSAWTDGVCGGCGYACAHPEYNSNGEPNYSDVYLNSISLKDNGDGNAHLHTYNVKRTCLNCEHSWIEKLVDIPEEHKIKDLDNKGVYAYNSDEHWMVVPHGCSCGYIEKYNHIGKESHNYIETAPTIYESEEEWHTLWKNPNWKCYCGSAFSQEWKSYIGWEPHADSNHDNVCDFCFETVQMKPSNELDELAKQFYDIVNQQFKFDNLSGSDRLFMQGFIGSLHDAVEDLESVSEGGLVNGEDIVHTMAMIEIQNWATDTDKYFGTDSVKGLKQMAEAANNAADVLGFDISDAFGLAKGNNNFTRFMDELNSENNKDVLQFINSFTSPQDFYSLALCFDGFGMIVDGSVKMFDSFNRVLDYEQAKAFSSVIIHRLEEIRDTTVSWRLRNELDEYIKTLDEASLATTLQKWFGVDNATDGAKLVFDSAGFMTDLMGQGWFGDDVAETIKYIKGAKPVEIVSGGFNVATLIADTPSAIAALGGYDTDQMVKTALSMNSIVDVINLEIEYYGHTGTNIDRLQSYRNIILLSRTFYQELGTYLNAATGWSTDIKRELKKLGLAEFKEDEIVELIEEIENCIKVLDAVSQLSDDEIMYLISIDRTN